MHRCPYDNSPISSVNKLKRISRFSLFPFFHFSFFYFSFYFFFKFMSKSRFTDTNITERESPKSSHEGMVRWCWVNFQCRGVPLIWILVGQGPTALAVGAGWVVLTFFLSSIFSLFFLPLWEICQYRLKYCHKGPANPK